MSHRDCRRRSGHQPHATWKTSRTHRDSLAWQGGSAHRTPLSLNPPNTQTKHKSAQLGGGCSPRHRPQHRPGPGWPHCPCGLPIRGSFPAGALGGGKGKSSKSQGGLGRWRDLVILRGGRGWDWPLCLHLLPVGPSEDGKDHHPVRRRNPRLRAQAHIQPPPFHSRTSAARLSPMVQGVQTAWGREPLQCLFPVLVPTLWQPALGPATLRRERIPLPSPPAVTALAQAASP